MYSGFSQETSILSPHYGRSGEAQTRGLRIPNGPMKAISAKNSFFRPFPLGKPRSSALPNPLFPSAPKMTVGRYVVTETLPEQKSFGERPFAGCIVLRILKKPSLLSQNLRCCKQRKSESIIRSLLQCGEKRLRIGTRTKYSKTSKFFQIAR